MNTGPKPKFTVDESGQVLTLVIDVNPISWEALAKATPLPKEDGIVYSTEHRNTLFSTMVDQIFIYINAFLLLNKANQICVIGTTPDDNITLYPPNDKLLDATFNVKPTDSTDSVDPSSLRGISLNRFGYAASRVKAALLDLIDRPITSSLATSTTTEDVPPCLLAGALSKALLFSERQKKKDRSLSAKILLLNVSPGHSSYYLPIMNVIFLAQKTSIPIDSLTITSSHAATINTNTNTSALFLQQAAHLTHGAYDVYSLAPPALSYPNSAIKATDSKPNEGKVKLTFTLNKDRLDTVPASVIGLSQHLILKYLTPSTIKPLLKSTHLSAVDLRATCECHKTHIEIGYVCPVCLTVYCNNKLLRCRVCRTLLTAMKARPRPNTTTNTTTNANTSSMSGVKRSASVAVSNNNSNSNSNSLNKKPKIE